MRAARLTVKEIQRKTTPGLHGDGGGLWLQITKTGVKSWLFRFMVKGKAYGMGLGPLHSVTLAEARHKAANARRLLVEGINPLEERRRLHAQDAANRARTMSFAACSAQYIAAHRAAWKNAKHGEQWSSTLQTYVHPVIGKLPVGDIDTALIVKVLTQRDPKGNSFWEVKNETASRVRGRIEAILGWATTSGFRSGDNPARWKGNLENLLANISKRSRVKNHPSLPWQQVDAFMSSLDKREGIAARAVEFTILTACRSNEVRGARWSEIDLDAKIWTIPSSRMKAGREHEVPLSVEALALLKRLHASSELVFPGIQNQVLSDMSLTQVIRRMVRDGQVWTDRDGRTVTVHGFRSTFRMWAAEATNYPREVAEHALAHQLPDAVERAYQRGTQFAKRIELMRDWGSLCKRASH
ncbi:MAG: site-specific integrase [Betaproteobacteria bacterium]|nr:site-specific integrase [Betaproteobacteria bacterium]